MERLTEIVATWRGVWYRKFEDDPCALPHRRISPRSYRMGYADGGMYGFTTAFVLGVVVMAALFGAGIVNVP